MAQKLYRVVEVNYGAKGRQESEIGCGWKPERAAKDEMRAMIRKHPGRSLAIQKAK